jgi:hypothetical protein
MDRDEINNPVHYTLGQQRCPKCRAFFDSQVWDFTTAKGLNYLRGCVVKYLVRAGEKDQATELEDLHKAQAYLCREILRVEDEREYNK